MRKCTQLARFHILQLGTGVALTAVGWCVFGGPSVRGSIAGLAGYWLECVLGYGAVPRPVFLVVLMSF